MNMRRSIWIVLACAAAGIGTTPVPAQQPRERTVGAFLEFLAAKTDADCARNREAFEKVRAKAPPREQVFFEVNQEICACMQQTIPAALRALSPAERSRKISDPSEVSGITLPALQKCSSLELRSLFGGKTCPAFTRTMTRDNLALDQYCSCMKKDIDRYSDAQAVQIGRALMDYLDALGKANRDGTPPPARPALIDPLNQTSLRCGEAARVK